MIGRAGRLVVLALLLAVLAGCVGGATSTEPAITHAPTSSTPVLGEAELAVCDGVTRMSQGVTAIRAIRLRRGAGDSLGSALETVIEGQQLVLDYAPSRMLARVRTLGLAIANITIAVEDLRTTDRPDAAASNIRRRTTALRRAIDSFGSWVGCPGVATDGPTSTPGA